MKLQDILSSLMMDDTYKGRGKYHSKVSPHTWAPQTSSRGLSGSEVFAEVLEVDPFCSDFRFCEGIRVFEEVTVVCKGFQGSLRGLRYL